MRDIREVIRKAQETIPPESQEGAFHVLSVALADGLATSSFAILTGSVPVRLFSKRDEDGNVLLTYPDGDGSFEPAEDVLERMLKDVRRANEPVPPETLN